MNKVLGFIKVMRPHQWTKNLFIFSAILFANKFLVKSLVIKNIIGFFIFWTALLIIWFLLGLPLGPGAELHYEMPVAN